MSAEVFVHPTAIVEKGAFLDAGVSVGPYCIVGSHVRLGKGTRLLSHAVVTGHTTLGEENEVFPFASVGHAPQDLKYKGEPTLLIVGDRNRIREGATLQPGTVGGGGKTVVGNGNLFMANTHIAHDCIVGDDNVMANSAALAGHVTVCNKAVLGGMVGIHQFCTVGDMAMIGIAAVVVQDVPHFCTVEGNRAVLRGLNIVAMRRRGISAEQVTAVRQAYKTIFLSGFPTVDEAVARCQQDGLLVHSEVARFVEFVRASKRGVVRPASDSSEADIAP